MEVPLTTTQPSCFGKHWDPNHVECKGGLDWVYKNPRNQTNMRDRCSWFESCQRATQQPQPPAQIIPTSSIVRPPTDVYRPFVPQPPAPPVPPPAPPTYTPPRPPVYQPPPAPTPSYQPAQPVQPVQQPYQQVAPGHMLVRPHDAQYGPQYVYAPYSHPASQVPQFLTVPEPVRDDVSIWSRLLHDVFRSGIKGIALSIAAFFDSNPIRRYK